MVGRLVQEQHVGLRDQQATQRDAPSFTARELGHIGVPVRQSQRIRGDFELAIEFPGADRIDLILQCALFLQQLVHFVIAHRLSKFHADLVEAIQERLGVGNAFFDIAAHILVRVQLRLLLQESNLDAGLWPSLAVDLGIESGHDA